MADVELTELQTKIYEIVKEDETVSKKNIAKRLDSQIRTIASPVKSLLDSGVLVTDEYGDYSLAAGVREDDFGSISVPSTAAPATPTGSVTEGDDGDADGTDDDNLYSDYWKKYPEELVTHYQEEGLDALKRNALQSALENTPGVGKKALNSSLHWFDIDEDVRRDPTTLMRALEDAGVKHNIVGRIVREVFLPEKQYSQYIKTDTDIIIDRGRRTQQRRRTEMVGSRRRPDDTGEYYEERYDESRSRRRPDDTGEHYEERYDESRRRRDEPQQADEPPWWYRDLASRVDALSAKRDPPDVRDNQHPHIVVEPVLDDAGNPIPDPNNPGQYLERKIVFDAPGSSAQVQSAPDPRLEQVLQLVEEQKEELARLNSIVSEVETDRKISDAIGSRIDPLFSKIANLEKTEPIHKAGLSDEQYKLQTEKEIFQDVTNSIENTVSNVLEPILAGLQETQKMQAMQEIINMERRDNVLAGTYLKYVGGRGGGDEGISKERVGGTIDLIKRKTGGGK